MIENCKLLSLKTFYAAFFIETQINIIDIKTLDM